MAASAIYERIRQGLSGTLARIGELSGHSSYNTKYTKATKYTKYD